MKKYRIVLQEIIIDPEEKDFNKGYFIAGEMGIDFVTLQENMPSGLLYKNLKLNANRLIKEYIKSKGE